MYGFLPTLNPKMFRMLVTIPYVERLGAGMLLLLCVLLLEPCARFGAGMLVPYGVPLQGAATWVLLAVRVVCTVWGGHAGGAQGAAAGAA